VPPLFNGGLIMPQPAAVLPQASPQGFQVYVVQPFSVLTDRRMRRAKSDGIDAELLLRTLLAWLRGEPRVCSMVLIPDQTDEDARRAVRERRELLLSESVWSTASVLRWRR
jgi:hypothetical protein